MHLRGRLRRRDGDERIKKGWIKALTQCPSTVASSSSPTEIFPLIWFTEQAPPRKGCREQRETVTPALKLLLPQDQLLMVRLQPIKKKIYTFSLNSSSVKHLVFSHSMVTFPPSSSVMVPYRIPLERQIQFDNIRTTTTSINNQNEHDPAGSL